MPRERRQSKFATAFTAYLDVQNQQKASREGSEADGPASESSLTSPPISTATPQQALRDSDSGGPPWATLTAAAAAAAAAATTSSSVSTAAPPATAGSVPDLHTHASSHPNFHSDDVSLHQTAPWAVPTPATSAAASAASTTVSVGACGGDSDELAREGSSQSQATTTATATTIGNFAAAAASSAADTGLPIDSSNTIDDSNNNNNNSNSNNDNNNSNALALAPGLVFYDRKYRPLRTWESRTRIPTLPSVPYCVVVRAGKPQHAQRGYVLKAKDPSEKASSGTGSVIVSWCFTWDLAPKDLLQLPGVQRGFQVEQVGVIGDPKRRGGATASSSSAAAADVEGVHDNDQPSKTWLCRWPPLTIERPLKRRYRFCIRAWIDAPDGVGSFQRRWTSGRSAIVEIDLEASSTTIAGSPNHSPNSSPTPEEWASQEENSLRRLSQALRCLEKASSKSGRKAHQSPKTPFKMGSSSPPKASQNPTPKATPKPRRAGAFCTSPSSTVIGEALSRPASTFDEGLEPPVFEEREAIAPPSSSSSSTSLQPRQLSRAVGGPAARCQPLGCGFSPHPQSKQTSRLSNVSIPELPRLCSDLQHPSAQPTSPPLAVAPSLSPNIISNNNSNNSSNNTNTAKVSASQSRFGLSCSSPPAAASSPQRWQRQVFSRHEADVVDASFAAASGIGAAASTASAASPQKAKALQSPPSLGSKRRRAPESISDAATLGTPNANRAGEGGDEEGEQQQQQQQPQQQHPESPEQEHHLHQNEDDVEKEGHLQEDRSLRGCARSGSSSNRSDKNTLSSASLSRTPSVVWPPSPATPKVPGEPLDQVVASCFWGSPRTPAGGSDSSEDEVDEDSAQEQLERWIGGTLRLMEEQFARCCALGLLAPEPGQSSNMPSASGGSHPASAASAAR